MQPASLTKDEFTALVRDALRHLFDYARLEQHPLTAWLPAANGTQAQHLSQTLVQAIEQLDPGDDFFYGAKERRSFTILWNRYVEMMPIDDVLAELGLSKRQFHRDHSLAVEALANSLWHSWKIDTGRLPPPAPAGPHLALAQAEAAKLAAESDTAQHSLDALLADVLHTLTPRLQATPAQLATELPPHLPPICGMRVAIRQILLQLLNHALNAAPAGQILVNATAQPKTVTLQVTVNQAQPDRLDSLTPDSDISLAICRELAALNNGALDISRPAVATWQARLILPCHKPVTVLIVDDSDELIALFRRYLSGSRFQPHGLRHARQALPWAKTNRPDLIILDIMMPNQDGYELLQRFRHQPDFARTPIIICSIIADPGLAHSLGATAVLKKPVSRQSLLEALEQATGEPPFAAPSANSE